ncbi:hypothetical protein FVER14953_20170 [Fusarium verticillioides]|nr:hypothetical protein FVER14953_20170 [Fusarium verticillioides]
MPEDRLVVFEIKHTIPTWQSSCWASDSAATHVTLKGFEDFLELFTRALDNDAPIAVFPASGNLFQNPFGQTFFTPS